MIPLRDDNPVRRRPVVTIGLILLNVAVFLWQLSLSPDEGQYAVYQLGFMPGLFFGYAEMDARWISPAATVLTSMFLHGGFLHLAGNMLYLWIFGDNIEERIGRFRFVVFYLLCGAVAAFAQALPDRASTLPMIGASGAISGVLGAYLVLYPRVSVLVAVPLLVIFYTLRVPAVVVLGFWFVAQLIGSFADRAGGGVAFVAHIGGFVAGAAAIRWFLLERRPARY